MIFIVVALVIAVVFLIVCLLIVSRQHVNDGSVYDGQILVTVPEEGRKIFTLELNGDPEELGQKKTVIFKVVILQTENV